MGGDKMNNKGFTLIELLGVLVLLTVILGVATFSVFSVIESSRTRSEKLFVEKLSDSIDDYLDLHGASLYKGSTEYVFSKCLDKSCQNKYEVTAYSLQNCAGDEHCNVRLSDLVEEGLVEEEDIINPRNNEKCLDIEQGIDPEVMIFKDSDYVYYYYVDLSGDNTACAVDFENGYINTLPDSLKEEVGIE